MKGGPRANRKAEDDALFDGIGDDDEADALEGESLFGPAGAV